MPRKTKPAKPVFGHYKVSIRFTDGLRIKEEYTLPVRQAVKLKRFTEKMLKEAETTAKSSLTSS